MATAGLHRTVLRTFTPGTLMNCLSLNNDILEDSQYKGNNRKPTTEISLARAETIDIDGLCSIEMERVNSKQPLQTFHTGAVEWYEIIINREK